MKTLKLLILFLCIFIGAFGQSVPNTLTFGLRDIVDAVRPDGVGQTDTFFKSTVAANCTVTINGHSEVMTWLDDNETTVTLFVTNYATSFPDVTLVNTGSGYFTATSNLLGLEFASASTISGVGNTVSTTTPASYTVNSNMVDLFDQAVTSKFDSYYFALYSTGHLIYNQRQFRNYGGTPTPVPVPVIGDAHYLGRTHFLATWSKIEGGAQSYLLYVSTASDFSSHVAGYNGLDVDTVDVYSVTGLTANTVYYYRVKAVMGDESDYSSSSKLQTAYWWYLPSLQELDDMYDNLRAGGIGWFDDDYYWSSTEYNSTQAYETTMLNGTYQATNKGTGDHVRPVRHFSTAHNYAVGSSSNSNGFITYKSDNGDGTWKYYECSQFDLSQDKAWSNVTSTEVTGTSADRGTGYQNTALIIGQAGHTDSAAKLCYDYDED